MGSTWVVEKPKNEDIARRSNCGKSRVIKVLSICCVVARGRMSCRICLVGEVAEWFQPLASSTKKKVKSRARVEPRDE